MLYDFSMDAPGYTTKKQVTGPGPVVHPLLQDLVLKRSSAQKIREATYGYLKEADVMYLLTDTCSGIFLIYSGN